MPYCLRLLQALILPQKLSRRSVINIVPAVSGVAWIRTGTFKSAMRRVSAMARSSPKFGSVTMTPSMRSRFARNRAAHFFASSRVSTAPHLLSSGPSATTPMAGIFERGDDLLAAGLRQVIREEAPVSDDHTKCHLLVHFASSMMARSHAGIVMLAERA